MPNYRADPDVWEVISSGFQRPDVDGLELFRLEKFLAADHTLEVFWAKGTRARAPAQDLHSMAEAAMEAYEQRTDRLPVGWRKLLVLRAAVAGCEENLDDWDIQNWVYDTIRANAGWLGEFDDDIDRDKPLREVYQRIGLKRIRSGPSGFEAR